MPDYDFSKLEPEGDKKKEKKSKKEGTKDLRRNYRITQCCGNCKYFIYTGVKSRRGFCKLSDPNYRFGLKIFRQPHIKDLCTDAGFPPTHTTNLCDAHAFKATVYSITQVGEYVGRKFNVDGTENFD